MPLSEAIEQAAALFAPELDFCCTTPAGRDTDLFVAWRADSRLGVVGELLDELKQFTMSPFVGFGSYHSQRSLAVADDPDRQLLHLITWASAEVAERNEPALLLRKVATCGRHFIESPHTSRWMNLEIDTADHLTRLRQWSSELLVLASLGPQTTAVVLELQEKASYIARHTAEVICFSQGVALSTMIDRHDTWRTAGECDDLPKEITSLISLSIAKSLGREEIEIAIRFLDSWLQQQIQAIAQS